MFRNTTKKLIVTAAAMGALAAPAGAAVAEDMRSPSVDAAAAEVQQPAYQDLRNPDSKAAAIEAERRRSYQDLRNPDSKAAAIEAEQARLVAAEPAPAESVQGPGFDWGDAGIGAGVTLGLLLITASVMFSVVHRRNRTATT